MRTQALTTLLCLFLTFGFAQKTRMVSGKITDGKNPLQNVNVVNKAKKLNALTAKDGSYSIEVETGDILQYSHTGMKSYDIAVEDVTRFLSPIMVPDAQQLEEVTVVGSNRKSQKELSWEYASNKTLIRTAFGFMDAETAPGQMRFLNEDEINPIGLCILGLLRSQFAGVRVAGDCMRGGAVFIRGRSSVLNPRSAIYDVDGMIFSDTPIWIIADAIKRVAILNSLALTARYGSIAAGGVIVINTKAGNVFPNPDGDKPFDQAKLRNNYLVSTPLSNEQIGKNAAQYLQELRSANSLEGAKQVFEKYAKSYRNSPYFFLDAYDYFFDKWQAVAYADEIIDKNYALFDDHPVLLKALGYVYQEQDRMEKANAIFKEVFILRPHYGQSYMDMANSYRDLKKAKKAASMYARYAYLLEQDFFAADKLGFTAMLDREYNNLLTLNRNELVHSKKAKASLVRKEYFEGTRLVFEWNDSEAEFELQFVNPGNQFFNWKHSLADNDRLIKTEKKHGFSTTEYLIDNSLPGTWKVNVKYLGNKSLTPTYLKVTVYDNYGDRSQRKEIDTYKLDVLNVNQELFTLTKQASVVSQ